MTGRKNNLTLIRRESQNQTLRLALDAFLADKQAGGRTAKTLGYYEYQLTKFLEHAENQGVTELTAVTPASLRSYMIALQQRGLSSKSQDAAYRALQAWLNWCVKQGMLTASPLALVSRPKPERKILRALEVDEVRMLLDAAESSRDKAVILCLLSSGLRVAEFVALNIEDWDRKEGTVRVRHGKGGKERMSFFGPKAKAALVQYLYSRGRTQGRDPLWVSEHGNTRLTIQGVQQLLRRIGTKAGVPGVSPHAFRRTCALWCHREGWRLSEIQRLLGHQDLSVLRQYLDLDDSDIAGAHRNAPPDARL